MKDYSISKEESKKFIKFFKFKKNKIKIFKGKGKDIIPYSDEAKNELLSQMENQIENAKVVTLNYKDKKRDALVIIIGSIAFSLAALVLITFCIASAATSLLNMILLGDIVLTSAFLILSPIIEKKLSLKLDFEKNKFIKENQEILNEEIKKDPTLQNTITKSLTKK